jgi:hypothetical protein
MARGRRHARNDCASTRPTGTPCAPPTETLRLMAEPIPTGPFVERLLRTGEPSTRYKLALAGFGGNANSARAAIPLSARVVELLSERTDGGRIPGHPYAKWAGAHWVLSLLADLGYPPGERALLPLAEQVLAWLFEERRVSRRRPRYEPYLAPIVTIAGRPRIHASLEGNALFALLALGLADERADRLAERLIEFQWADGGWNCDRSPAASHSSFEETLIPLRGLVWHARVRKSAASASAARRAAELLLERKLFKRRSTGRIIARDFTRLHYPCYWHYDVLFALKVMAEGGFLADPRCEDAIALVCAKRQRDGGFPAEEKFWGGARDRSRRSLVSWGPVAKTTSNEFVTADALSVLAALYAARKLRRQRADLG